MLDNWIQIDASFPLLNYLVDCILVIYERIRHTGNEIVVSKLFWPRSNRPLYYITVKYASAEDRNY